MYRRARFALCIVLVATGCSTPAPDELTGLVPIARQEQRTVEPTELVDGRRGAIETVQRRTLYAAPEHVR